MHGDIKFCNVHITKPRSASANWFYSQQLNYRMQNSMLHKYTNYYYMFNIDGMSGYTDREPINLDALALYIRDINYILWTLLWYSKWYIGLSDNSRIPRFQILQLTNKGGISPNLISSSHINSPWHNSVAVPSTEFMGFVNFLTLKNVVLTLLAINFTWSISLITKT
jgi:hypothetical protein